MFDMSINGFELAVQFEFQIDISKLYLRRSFRLLLKQSSSGKFENIARHLDLDEVDR